MLDLSVEICSVGRRNQLPSERLRLVLRDVDAFIASVVGLVGAEVIAQTNIQRTVVKPDASVRPARPELRQCASETAGLDMKLPRRVGEVGCPGTRAYTNELRSADQVTYDELAIWRRCGSVAEVRVAGIRAGTKKAALVDALKLLVQLAGVQAVACIVGPDEEDARLLLVQREPVRDVDAGLEMLRALGFGDAPCDPRPLEVRGQDRVDHTGGGVCPIERRCAVTKDFKAINAS